MLRRPIARGFYFLEVPGGRYPFVTIVKAYAEEYLEYWCHDIDLSQDRTLDAAIDKLEVYGLHVFVVKGAYNALMVYFRPMSLVKYQRGESDIAPDLRRIRVRVDDTEAEILQRSEVKESNGAVGMTAYLLQVANPNGDGAWDRLDVEVTDVEGNRGAATIFR